MSDVIERKCHGCPTPVEINRNNVTSVIYYKKKYYHLECFCKIAEKRSQSKTKSVSTEWQAVLNNISEIKADTQKMVLRSLNENDLNNWLLSNYDVASVPKSFWQLIADLEKGVYKRKKCRAISMETLLGAWNWGQKRLNKINSKNKTNNCGPKNDDDRLRYDLAILIGHMGDYIKYTTRTKEEVVEIKNRIQNTNKINCENIYVQSKEKQNNENILDLMNDIF
jgi:hypothetical protein